MTSYSFIPNRKSIILSGKAKLNLAATVPSDIKYVGSGIITVTDHAFKTLSLNFICNRANENISISGSIYKELNKLNQQVIAKTLRVWQKLQLNIILAGSK